MMARQFRLAGHQIVADAAQADIAVINTCTVTNIAAQKSRTAVRRAKGAAPAARVVVTGCHAEIAPHDFPVADWVINNRQKQQLPGRVLGEHAASPDHIIAPPEKDVPFLQLSALKRTRSFVKIQDGCDMHCTFCLTRVARGPSRSRPLADILDEVRQHVDDGVQEVVLTGVHVGAYGKDLDTDLGELIRRLMRETDVPRLRLSSLEPWNFQTDWLSLWENRRLCRHLHMSLQSGSNDILRRMRRAYTAEKFAEKVQAAQQLIPDLAVTTDLIVGFPGETEETFAESVQFVREMNFARAHVFPFSHRPGTPAATMPDQVPHRVKKARAAALRVVTDESSYRFRASLLGRTFAVLWEQPDPRTVMWSGLTDNYVRVSVHSMQSLHNQILPAQLTALSDAGAEGELVGTGIISQSGNAC